MKRYVALSLLAVSAFAQAPQLTRTTQMTIQQLAVELHQVNQDFAAADALVKKEMPGWHLSQQTLQPEKDAPKPEVKPEPKK